MSRIRLEPLSILMLALILNLAVAGCGYGSHNYMTGAGMPAITQLSPSTTAPGGAPFTLTVTGSGFGTDSLVYWGTTTRATTYSTTTQVTAAITADDIANTGSVQVYVHSGGANSNAMTFTIQ
jgi:trimeric autotransporter adhesin